MFGWGEGYLHQKEDKITGVIDSYDIEGIVSGKTVYIVLMYGSHVHYTARLEILGELLTGYYFDATDKEQKKGSRTSFIRTVEPFKQ
ncbi:MAG TPA: hypothetical protein VLZ03_07010 [Thermodesulfobacteriota bacterium]|nr:hypothetical protein [Thermodesulfobacteriota bacterium]